MTGLKGERSPPFLRLLRRGLAIPVDSGLGGGFSTYIAAAGNWWMGDRVGVRISSTNPPPQSGQRIVSWERTRTRMNRLHL